MNNYKEEDYEELEPSPRKRTRRTRLIDSMSDARLYQREHSFHKRKSKPKGFKHNRKNAQKDIDNL